MKLISERFTSQLLRFKAPKNSMFLIDAVCFSAITATAGVAVFILDYLVEDEITSTVGAIEDFIAVFGTAIAGNNSLVTDINHKSKFITIAKSSSGNVDVDIVIYGEIVKATRTELLIEWFRKGI